MQLMADIRVRKAFGKIRPKNRTQQKDGDKTTILKSRRALHAKNVFFKKATQM